MHYRQNLNPALLELDGYSQIITIGIPNAQVDYPPSKPPGDWRLATLGKLIKSMTTGRAQAPKT